MGGENSTTTKVHVFYALFIAAVVCAIFAYFICVTMTYSDALADPEELKMMMEEDKKMDEDKPKDDMASM